MIKLVQIFMILSAGMLLTIPLVSLEVEAASLKLNKEVFIKQYLPEYLIFSGETTKTSSLLKATLTIPGGKSITSDVSSSDTGTYKSGFYLQHDYPVGEYKISIAGSSATFIVKLYESTSEQIQPVCQGCQTGTITRYIDGDTLYIDNKRVRLSLINTPERDEDGYHESLKFATEFCPLGIKIWYNQDAGYLGTSSSVGVVAEVLCHNESLNGALVINDHATIIKRHCDTSEFRQRSWAMSACDELRDEYAEFGNDGQDTSKQQGNIKISNGDNNFTSNDGEEALSINIESDLDDKIVNAVPSVPDEINIGGSTFKPKDAIDGLVNNISDVLPKLGEEIVDTIVPTVEIESSIDFTQWIIFLAVIIVIVVVVIIIIKKKRGSNDDYLGGDLIDDV